jgi:hypothetical protein
MSAALSVFGGMICAVQILSAQGTADGFFHVIRANDLDALRQLAAKSDMTTVKNGLDATPLHFASTSV